jgi:hypothetical protein
MKTNAKLFEVTSVTAIENDLVTARREGRFEDALHHLDEIFVIHTHTESEPTKARCAALLAAPEAMPPLRHAA